MSTAPQATSPLDGVDLTKARLTMAARIAAGIASNPEIYTSRDWEGEVARVSWSIAGRLLVLAESGGC